MLTLILTALAGVSFWSLPPAAPPEPTWYRFVFCAIITHRAIICLFFSDPVSIDLKYFKGSKFKPQTVTLQKWGRLRTFTVQSWCLQALYFAYPTPQLRAVIFATAHLVSSVTSFVLIPLGNNKFLFTSNALWMHNANTILVHLDLYLSGATIALENMGAPVLWAIWYVVFTWTCMDWIPYIFLDYSVPYAIPLHLGLCVALLLFFLVGVGLAHVPHAWVAQLLLVRLVTRYRK